jgi:chemotaxis signal transduction protein
MTGMIFPLKLSTPFIYDGAERIVGILGEKVKDFISVQLEEFKSTDFFLNPVPFLSGVLSRDQELIQYVDIAAFFQFLSTDLFQSIKKESHEF